MGLKKAMKRIKAKIEFNTLLAEGQKNDGKHTDAFETLSLIQGFKESLVILVEESIDPTTIQKKLIKKAGQYLSTESDTDTLKMLRAIKNDYMIDSFLDREPYIDYIEGVQVAETFQNTFNSKEFLEQINYI